LDKKLEQLEDMKEQQRLQKEGAVPEPDTDGAAEDDDDDEDLFGEGMHLD
jgi:hypothetical protein